MEEKTSTVENPTYRGVLSADGHCGPIEHRVGRRLIRLIESNSTEGRRLLSKGQVELFSPEGASLGKSEIEKACRAHAKRLESTMEQAELRDEAPHLSELELLHTVLSEKSRPHS